MITASRRQVLVSSVPPVSQLVSSVEPPPPVSQPVSVVPLLSIHADWSLPLPLPPEVSQVPLSHSPRIGRLPARRVPGALIDSALICGAAAPRVVLDDRCAAATPT